MNLTKELCDNVVSLFDNEPFSGIKEFDQVFKNYLEMKTDFHSNTKVFFEMLLEIFGSDKMMSEFMNCVSKEEKEYKEYLYLIYSINDVLNNLDTVDIRHKDKNFNTSYQYVISYLVLKYEERKDLENVMSKTANILEKLGNVLEHMSNNLHEINDDYE